MKNIYLLCCVGALAVLPGCSEQGPCREGETMMRFVPSLPETRATDSAFEKGDSFGIYAVEYKEGRPSPLQISGNWGNNSKSSFDGTKWTVTPPVWWKDDTKFDVIAYYPYDGKVNSVDEYRFELAEDQRNGGYTMSDFMWAKTAGVERSEGDIALNFKHKLSRLDINLVKGEDYEGSLPANAEVRILNTTTSAIIDFETGDVQKDPYGTERTILARQTGTGKYSAIIVPQKLLNQIPLVEIIANDVSYLVSTRFIFEQGTRHTINITLSSDPEKVVINIGGGIQNWN